MYRIGLGYDIHQLVEGRDLIIGGVNIPYEKGLLGHSDADVLIHSVIDALLGSLALGDIGTLFPDNDQKYKDIDSKILLNKVYELVKKNNFEINNIDCNIIAQAPKMMPYITQMRETLSEILQTDTKNISIKAKTKEHLDSVGEKLAIEASCIAMLKKI